MGSEITVDKRIIKTKMAIRNAFAELLSEKDMNEITIKDISDRAIINRKTFYSYYAGVYQLIDEIENEIVTALSEIIEDEDFESLTRNPYSLFQKLTTIINNNLDFCNHLMKNGRNTNLLAKIAIALKTKVKSSYLDQSSLDEKTFDQALNYVFAGMITVYQNWFNSDRSQSIEDLSRMVSTLVFSGLSGINQM